MPFKIGDRVTLIDVGISFGPETLGTVTEVHPVPNYPELAEYSVEWDDGLYPDEIWDKNDFKEAQA